MSDSAWGNVTEYFFKLTPDCVLAAVEATGLECTGRCFALNSYENRVYEVELEMEGPSISRKRVVKFYRPGRWTEAQILQEHQFLFDLRDHEIPVVAPLLFPEGGSLKKTPAGDLWYTIFPKVGGRVPDELNDDQLKRIGRFLGRIHNVGTLRKASDRVLLNTKTYGEANLKFLLEEGWILKDWSSRYEAAAREVFRLGEKLFADHLPIRIHGDCHPGNLLWADQGPFFLDFDDMVQGPPVQDFWLLIPGRDAHAKSQLEVLIQGYEEMRFFDRQSLVLIEVLRALRFIHFDAWIARRWEDPAFPVAFPKFNTVQYWTDQTHDLEEQVEWIGKFGDSI